MPLLLREEPLCRLYVPRGLKTYYRDLYSGYTNKIEMGVSKMSILDDTYPSNSETMEVGATNPTVASTEEQPSGIIRDAGVIAAARLRERSKARRFGAFLTKVYVFLTIAFFATTGLFGYDQWTGRDTGYAVDTRPCEYKLNDRVTVTGVRTYSYPYFDVMGMRFIEKDKVTEETKVDVRGKAFAVVGITGEDWWGTSVDQGERGIQLLEKHDTYTFVFEEGIGVVPYSKLCR